MTTTRLAAPFAALALASSCGADVLYLAIHIGYVEPSNTCYRNNDFKDTRKTADFGMAAHWTVWQGPDEKFYLDMGNPLQFDMGDAPDVTIGTILEGTRGEDDQYTFVATSSSTTARPADPFTTKVERKVEIKLDLSEDEVTGTATVSSTQSCNGTCANDFATKNPSCSIGYPLRGRQAPVDTTTAGAP